MSSAVLTPPPNPGTRNPTASTRAADLKSQSNKPAAPSETRDAAIQIRKIDQAATFPAAKAAVAIAIQITAEDIRVAQTKLFTKVSVGSDKLPAHLRTSYENAQIARSVEPASIELAFRSNNPKVQLAAEELDTFAPTELPIVLLGPSGTGKSLASRLIHASSSRSGERFVTVDPANLGSNEEAVRSEVFGHKKGSYTGAFDARKGLVAAADGGTLFIDELQDLPRSIQSQLLLFMQNGRFRPLGEDNEQSADVRIVVAINGDIDTLIKAGKLDPAFYQRVNGVKVSLPSLSERTEDLNLILKRSLANACVVNGLAGKVDGISQAAHKKLLGYSFPGNFRELDNLMRALSIRASRRGSSIIELADFRQSDLLSNETRTVRTVHNEAQNRSSNQPSAELSNTFTELRNMLDDAVKALSPYLSNPVRAKDVIGGPSVGSALFLLNCVRAVADWDKPHLRGIAAEISRRMGASESNTTISRATTELKKLASRTGTDTSGVNLFAGIKEIIDSGWALSRDEFPDELLNPATWSEIKEVPLETHYDIKLPSNRVVTSQTEIKGRIKEILSWADQLLPRYSDSPVSLDLQEKRHLSLAVFAMVLFKANGSEVEAGRLFGCGPMQAVNVFNQLHEKFGIDPKTEGLASAYQEVGSASHPPLFERFSQRDEFTRVYWDRLAQTARDLKRTRTPGAKA